MGNPFTLTFGKKPSEYIIRRADIEEIEKAFMDEPARSQTYLIRGVRGSGKTVLMTAIAKEIADNSDWVCVDLNSSQNLIDDLSYRLEKYVNIIIVCYYRKNKKQVELWCGIPLGLNNTFVGRLEGGNVGAMESSWRNNFNGSQYSFDCC